MKKKMQQLVTALLVTVMCASVLPSNVQAAETMTEPGTEVLTEQTETPVEPETESEVITEPETETLRETETVTESTEQLKVTKEKSTEEETEENELASSTYLDLGEVCYQVRDTAIDIGIYYYTDTTDVKFRWKAYNLDTKTWENIGTWNTGNWATWNPKAGNYWLHAEAQTGDGRTAEKTICFYVNRDYTPNYIQLDNITYTDTGHALEVVANYTTGSPTIQFMWQAYNLATCKWEIISDWNDSNKAVWTPSQGNYWLQVQAKATDGVIKQYTMCFYASKNYSSDYVDFSGICMMQNFTSVDMGVACTSADPNLTYKWQIYDVSANTWTTIANWTSSNWVTWHVVSGDYWVYVTARTSKGTEQNYWIGVSLKDKNYMNLNSVSLQKHSNSVDLGLNYVSYDPNTVFKWQIYDTNKGSWTTIQDWSKSSTAVWNVKTGSYWIYVTARNENGREEHLCQGITLKNTFKYLAIGNSLTIHPIEAGVWWGNWGMAATTPDKDYYHRVVASLQQSYDTVYTNCIYYKGWEENTSRDQFLSVLDSYLSYDTDLVTIQLGDNIIYGKETVYNDLTNLVNYIRTRSPNAKIMMFSEFCWPDATITAAQQNVCSNLGVTYLDLSPISGNPAYRVGTGAVVYGEDGNWHTITHGAVGAHPNDSGFEYMANLILGQLR